MNQVSVKGSGTEGLQLPDAEKVGQTKQKTKKQQQKNDQK